METVVLLSQQKPSDRIEVDLDLDELDATSAEMKATYAEIKDYVLKEHGLKVSNLYISQVKRKCGIEVGENYNLYYYDSILDAVVLRDKDNNELVIECAKANAQIVFDEPEDEGYLERLAREEPANYVSYALKPDGLQGYVNAMNVLN